MGVSTNGQICYGIIFKEGYEFPWDNDKYGGDIEKWWLYEICKYKSPFELFDENGNYIDKTRPPQSKIDEYYTIQKEFEKLHPLPVELVNYCSDDCPMYIITITNSCISNRRGYPVELNQKNDLSIKEIDTITLIKFCEKYCKPINDYDTFPEMEPKWYLSSYWG